MNDARATGVDVDTTYSEADWVSALLSIVHIMNLPSAETKDLPALVGCISFNRPNVLLSGEQNFSTFVVRMGLHPFHHDGSNYTGSAFDENEFDTWFKSQNITSNVYCSKNLRTNHTFPAGKREINLSGDSRPPFMLEPSVSRNLQICLAILFCSILFICLILTIVLRIKSYINRKLAMRKAQRVDREGYNGPRVHFAYDIGDTVSLSKPAVPGTTFGSNVYPSDHVWNANSQSLQKRLNRRSRQTHAVAYLHALARLEQKRNLALAQIDNGSSVHPPVVSLNEEPLVLIHSAAKSPIQNGNIPYQKAIQLNRTSFATVPFQSTFSSTSSDRGLQSSL